MIWRNSFRIAMAVAAFLMAVASCYAQSGAGGGGNITELDFMKYASRLGDYMQTDEGRRNFADIWIYDRTHPDLTFNDVAQTVKVHFGPGPVLDQFGNKRDCVGKILPGIRYINCDEDRIGRKIPKLTAEFQRDFYRFVFHELLVLIQLEAPVDGNALPSDYPIARRLKDELFHLEPHGEWMLGKQAIDSILKQGMWCTDNERLEADEQGQTTVRLLFWDQSKNVSLARVVLGSAKAKVKVVYRGQADIPQIDQDVKKTLDPRFRAAPGMFVPLQILDVGNSYGDIAMETTQNPIREAATYALSDGTELWSQILSRIYFKPRKSSTVAVSKMYGQCQTMESWSESDIAQFLPKLQDWINAKTSDEFEMTQTQGERK
ncbi:MAG: hypothetical protein JST80_03795 [Bdellovibrionales bacterium]|nr:hypothetical protein [Bdellovibrionales bacterium]